MLIRTQAEPKSSEITSQDSYLRRRDFLRSAGTFAALAGGAGALGCFDSQAPAAVAAAPRRAKLSGVKPAVAPYTVDEEQNTYEQATRYNNFYEFGTSKEDPSEKAHTLRVKPWSVAIEGECAKPGTIGLEDLLAPHALEERVYRFRCVEAWSMVIPWVGIPLGEVLQRFEPNSKAKFVSFETLYDPEQMPGQRRRVLDWPYREGLRIDEAMHPLALLAVGMYGEELPKQNGAPLRLVLPWKYGFKSIKSIVKIRFEEKMPATSWNLSAPREYGFFSNVNPEVDHPRWTQSRERRIGEFRKRATLPFNGYADQVASLYNNMDLRKFF